MGNFLPSTDAQRRDMMNAVGVRNIEELYADIPADLRKQAADAVAASKERAGGSRETFGAQAKDSVISHGSR